VSLTREAARRGPGPGWTPAARARITGRLFAGGGELLASAAAREDATGGFERGQRGAIRFAPRALPQDFTVPFEAERLEHAQLFVGAPRHHPRGVEILDAHQPACAVGARVEIAADRGEQ
jgi:hypothetical protein